MLFSTVFFFPFSPLRPQTKIPHILFLSNLPNKMYRFELQHQIVKRQLPKHFH